MSENMTFENLHNKSEEYRAGYMQAMQEKYFDADFVVRTTDDVCTVHATIKEAIHTVPPGGRIYVPLMSRQLEPRKSDG